MIIRNVLFITLIEVFLSLYIGFILTENSLRAIYENSGIVFKGNVWINWFGLSFILFALFSVVRGLLSKDKTQVKNRLHSKVFWLVFAISVALICIPFFLGKNPY